MSELYCLLKSIKVINIDIIFLYKTIVNFWNRSARYGTIPRQCNVWFPAPESTYPLKHTITSESTPTQTHHNFWVKDLLVETNVCWLIAWQTHHVCTQTLPGFLSSWQCDNSLYFLVKFFFILCNLYKLLSHILFHCFWVIHKRWKTFQFSTKLCQIGQLN